MKKEIIIFGTGEIAELAHLYITKDSDYDIVAFTADQDLMEGKSFLGKPLVAFEEVLDALAEHIDDDLVLPNEEKIEELLNFLKSYFALDLE